MKRKYGWPGRADCFAFSGTTEAPVCGALRAPSCAVEGKCPFFSTRAGAEEQREWTHVRAVKAGYYRSGDKYEPKGGR